MPDILQPDDIEAIKSKASLASYINTPLRDSYFSSALRAIALTSGLLTSGFANAEQPIKAELASAKIERTLSETEQQLAENIITKGDRAYALATEMIIPIIKERETLGYKSKVNFNKQPSLALLGTEDSPITSIPGGLELKRSSLDPELARLFTKILIDLDIKEGDEIAACFTGSLPGANIYFLAACEAVGAKVVLIGSASSSQWGANLPGLSWPEMQHLISNSGKFSFNPVAYSLGGYGDNGGDIKDRDSLVNAIKETEAIFIDSRQVKDSITYGIDRRIEIFQKYAPNAKLFVNIGGGTAAAGGHRLKALSTKVFQPETDKEIVLESPKSVARHYFLDLKKPVLNIRNPNDLKEQFDSELPLLTSKDANLLGKR